MPEVKNCRRCKKIFMYATGPQYCDICKRIEEDEFEKVRTFVRDFPGATVQEVTQETQVPSQLVYRFLKEGRLEVSESSPIAIHCENCGARVKCGRFCISCSKRLANDMINAGNSLKESIKGDDKSQKDGSGLRYLNGEFRDK